MKVVFLDMDGVLNSRRSMNAVLDGVYPPLVKFPTHTVDRDCVAHLRRAVVATGASLVVSSVWRLVDNGKDVWKALQWAGWVRPPMIGCTDRNNVRGESIDAWLREHPEVTSYAILDDEQSDIHQKDRLVLVRDREVGMTAVEADALIAMLGTEPRTGEMIYGCQHALACGRVKEVVNGPHPPQDPGDPPTYQVIEDFHGRPTTVRRESNGALYEVFYRYQDY